MKNYSSQSYNPEHTSAVTYFAITGFVLSTSVLIAPNAHARRIAPVEVVVYEGAPIDYSNREDVIFIDETPIDSGYSEVIISQNYAFNEASPSEAVATNNSAFGNGANNTNPAARQKPLPQAIARQAVPAKPVVIAAVAKADPITEVKLSKPFDKPKQSTEERELASFYADAKQVLAKSPRQKATSPSIKAKSIVSNKNIAKQKPKTNEVKLAVTAANAKEVKLVPNKPLMAKPQGKNPELYAFYMEVFADEPENLSNQSSKPIKRIVKKAAPQIIAKNKSKPKTVQLALQESQAKDPELVAFYHQVFADDKRLISQPSQAIVAAKAKVNSKVKAPIRVKDPVLVAFYEQEFGKLKTAKQDKIKSKQRISQTAKMTVAKTKLKSKIKRTVKVKDPELVAFYEQEFGKLKTSKNDKVISKKRIKKATKIASSKSSKKRIAKKAVSKINKKTMSKISTELAELQHLIDDLTERKII